MNTKNAWASATMILTALVAGAMAALLLALTSPPAQAQSGDRLELLSLKAVEITHDEGGLLGDFIDEPYLKVDGVEVWSGRSDPLRMQAGDVRNLAGVSATLSGQSARVQLWESDPGALNRPDDGPAEFFADYTDGGERTRLLTLNGGTYELTYRVVRPNTPPRVESPVKPAPGSVIRDRTPLISAIVRDAETDLTRESISLEVDGIRKPFFSYDVATDKLTYQSGRLGYGRHTVTVEATDAQGLGGEETWGFKVVKSRR